MATKNEHADKAQSEKDASGQKGVSQEQVGSGKEHDPNNFAKDPNAPERLAARVVMKATSATSIG